MLKHLPDWAGVYIIGHLFNFHLLLIVIFPTFFQGVYQNST